MNDLYEGANMNNKQYPLQGFTFSSQSDYNNALDEWNTVLYIKKNSDLANELIVYKLFCKLLEKNAFKTVIGLNFLKELRDNLIKMGKYKDEDLGYIVVPTSQRDKITTDKVNTVEVQGKSNSLRNAQIINVFLIITVLAMFAITIYT